MCQAEEHPPPTQSIHVLLPRAVTMLPHEERKLANEIISVAERLTLKYGDYPDYLGGPNGTNYKGP